MRVHGGHECVGVDEDWQRSHQSCGTTVQALQGINVNSRLQVLGGHISGG